jgi:hypothetical protein
MIDLIQSEFRKIVLKCINRYAKDNTLNPDNVQLMLGLNEEGNTYQIMVESSRLNCCLCKSIAGAMSEGL